MVFAAQPPLGAQAPLAAASAGSDQAKAKQIQQLIDRQGTSIQKIVVNYDVAVAQEQTVHSELLTAQAQVVSDQSGQAREAGKLRQAAVYEFVTGSSPDSVLDEIGSGSLNALLIQQEYARVLGGNLQDDINAFALKERQTRSAEAVLQSDQAKAQATVTLLNQQAQQARVALSQEDAQLGQVKGNLKSLLAAAAKARQQAQNAAEQALAEAQVPVNASGFVPSAPTINPSPGTYADPLRGISGLVAERVDQGVDYSGYGPIYAIGDGVVLSSVNAGWPGGTFISYRLTDGPAAGLVVYAGEDIYPQVQPGQTVTPGTQIGTMYEGSSGIETGWADPSGDGVTMARDYSQFSGENSSVFGYNFSTFLASVGAPGGVLQSNPPTGSLPPGWPNW